MRTVIYSLLLIFVMTTLVPAKDADNITIGLGKQKSAGKTGITVKFISVLEDSRCPEGVNCIWAGNATIKVKICDARGSKIAQMNTTLGPQGDQYGGYAVRLVSLKPLPTEKGKPAAAAYTAEFSVTRLTR